MKDYEIKFSVFFKASMRIHEFLEFRDELEKTPDDVILRKNFMELIEEIFSNEEFTQEIINMVSNGIRLGETMSSQRNFYDNFSSRIYSAGFGGGY